MSLNMHQIRLGLISSDFIPSDQKINQRELAIQASKAFSLQSVRKLQTQYELSIKNIKYQFDFGMENIRRTSREVEKNMTLNSDAYNLEMPAIQEQIQQLYDTLKDNYLIGCQSIQVYFIETLRKMLSDEFPQTREINNILVDNFNRDSNTAFLNFVQTKETMRKALMNILEISQSICSSVVENN